MASTTLAVMFGSGPPRKRRLPRSRLLRAALFYAVPAIVPGLNLISANLHRGTVG
jgi:hypothetical protein